MSVSDKSLQRSRGAQMKRASVCTDALGRPLDDLAGDALLQGAHR